MAESHQSESDWIVVERGPEFIKINPHLYHLNPTDERSPIQLILSIRNDGLEVSDVLHLWTYAQPPEQWQSTEALTERLDCGVCSFAPHITRIRAYPYSEQRLPPTSSV